MEGQTCAQNTAPSSLAMHRNSKSISKAKSKIRIIHILAPEIIKTDAANFRELVQKLTGKPRDEQRNCSTRQRSKSRLLPANRAGFHAGAEEGFRERKKVEEEVRERTKEEEVRERTKEEEVRERTKEEEEEIWRDANTGGGFLGGFSEFDQFQFAEESTSEVDVYEEPQVA